MSITTLAQLIAQVESNGNPFAMRFEPAHTPAPHNIVAMMHLCDCSYDTGKNLCSMSWGKYQIMGDELISLGLACSPLAYCMSAPLQDDYFDRYILADHLSLTLADILTDASKRQVFARLYNGPGNIPAYVKRIEDVATANGLQVVS
jgi:hypothetical protein